MTVLQRQHVAAVGCRTFCSELNSVFVFDILQMDSGGVHICSGCFAAPSTPFATDVGCTGGSY